tara:strand:+ start:501 stop:2207 length:1707 start_codon:yes stop_codon:yes gene_type:complete
MKKLKIGFLIDNNEVSSYDFDLIEHVKKSELFENPILISGYNKIYKNLFHRIKGVFKKNLFKVIDLRLIGLIKKLIHKIEYKSAANLYPNYEKKITLNKDTTNELISVEGLWSKTSIFLDFTEADLLKISEAKLDCIIRCGSGILKGKILNLPKFGILSIHHGDNRKNRGGPTGFWEVINNDPSSGFIIQKLNNELDGGEVLIRGNFMTKDMWLKNHAMLLEKSNIFFKNLLDYIAKNNSLPPKEGPRLHDKKLFRLNSSIILIYYFLKILAPKILKTTFYPKILRKIIAKIFGENVQRWSIAYSSHNGFSKSLWRYKEIKNPKNRFLADPFIFEKDKSTFIFVEDFFYSDKKGRISAIQITENSYNFVGVVLEENFHLSFPYVFENQGEIFMVPETFKNKDIRLYKCVEFPTKWKFEKILMNNISAADTMLIHRDDKWFMLTNICSGTYDDHQSELHIFYADNLMANEWYPLKSGNPVIFDSLTARNGGLFRENNELFRVNQIQGKDHYGKSFGINKIIELNINTYREERVSTINSDFKNDINSTHHFNANKKFAVVDFCRFERHKN